MTNEVFGRLTVIKRVEDYISPKGVKSSRWLCQCECNGKNSLKVFIGNDLRGGKSQSCGCLKREKTIERNKIGKINKMFRKYNTYDLSGEYGVGYTFKDEEFYFDLEDYDLIKDYC